MKREAMFKVRDRLERREKERSYVQSEGQAGKDGKLVQGREKLCSK